MDNIPSLRNYFQTNRYSVNPILFKKALEQHWDNLFECNFSTWDMFLHTGLTELHMFFMTRSTTFFRVTAFVITRVVFFLVRRQSSKGLL